MVTAVDPDFDVLEMGFDTYVVKPTTEAELLDTVSTLLQRSTYDDRAQEYFSLAARRAALEANKPRAELEASEEYAELEGRLTELRADLDEAFTDLDEEGFRAAFHSFSADAEE
jgi:DNA-binding response OmpR family regulator